MKNIIKFSFLLLLFIGCKRSQVESIGPNYLVPPKGFSVISFTATPNAIDFRSLVADSVVFNASFTNTVSWILTIKGRTSGARRQYTGLSNGITDLKWFGSHDEVYFFKSGETVDATLSFYGTTYTSKISIDIIRYADFTKCGTFPKDGDFENAVAITFPNWAKFNVTEQGVDSQAIDFNGNLVPSVEGKNYFYIKGVGDVNQVFVDGVQYIGPVNPKLPANADDVWVNMYIYGTGDPNCSVDLEYQEEDIDGSTIGYNGKDDDAFVTHINVSHKGWKLFSFKYSSLIPSANADFGGSGNKLHEPHRLVSFDLVALKRVDNKKPIEVYFDYPILTVGGPFKPCK